MLASLTQGALRFVGGKLSHEGEAELATPAAAIGIRGGTVTVHHDKHGTRVINHFGTITIHNAAGTVTISRPGFEVTILNWNTAPGDPVRVTADEIAHDLVLLTSKPGQNGGVRGLKTVVINDCGTGTSGTAGVQGQDCPSSPWIRTDAGESDAFQTILQATQQATGRTQGGGARRRGR